MSEDVGGRRFSSPYEYELTAEQLDRGWRSAEEHAARLGVDLGALCRDAGRVVT